MARTAKNTGTKTTPPKATAKNTGTKTTPPKATAKNTGTKTTPPKATAKNTKAQTAIDLKKRPNMYKFLNENLTIRVLDRRRQIEVEKKLKDYDMPSYYSKRLLVSPINYYQLQPVDGKNGNPKRGIVQEISMQSFRNCVNVQILERFDTYGDEYRPAFKLSKHPVDKEMEAFIILLACTEHEDEVNEETGEKERIYSDKAKALVKKHFALSTENEVISMCNKLLMLDWGLIKCEVWRILNFPNFKGKIEIPKHCLNVMGSTKRKLQSSTIVPD